MKKDVINEISLSDGKLSDKEVDNLVNNIQMLGTYADNTNTLSLLLLNMINKGEIVAPKEVEDYLKNSILDFHIIKQTIMNQTNSITIH